MLMLRIISADVALSNNVQVVLSAKITSELVSKIDDGRPSTGKVLALNSGFARKASATDDEIKAVCYDQLVSDVDKVIYNKDSNLRYGCNIIKIMEDIK